MKFSVGIPAYKSQYLKQCIQSVLDQTLVDFELIIVNDASPFDIDSILLQFSDPRIRYYKNDKNIGAENVVDNWNKCLSFAQGDYFILLGDDDEMMPNYLSTFDKLIAKFTDLHVFHCRSYIINENSQVISLTPSWPEWETVYDNIWHRMQGLRTQFVSDFVYKTSFLRETGGYVKLPMAWSSDDITAFEAANTFGIAHTQDIVFCYRQTPITLSLSGSVLLKLKAIKLEEQWYQNFINNHKPSNKSDLTIYNCITNGKNKYFLTKRIETIAYSGFRKGYLLTDFFYWIKNRQKFDLDFAHVGFAFILAIKKLKGHSNI